MTTSPDPARAAAFALLNAVTIDSKILTYLLPKSLDHLSGPDSARALRLTRETLRWANRADRMLGPYLRKRPDEPVLNALRLGVVELCQIGHMPHGVVNEMVSLMSANRDTKRQAGLVNAVLRRIGRDTAGWGDLPVPQLPKQLRKTLIAQYGKSTIGAIEMAHARGGAIDLSVKSDASAWADRLQAKLLPTGSLRLPERVEVSRAEGFEDGAWWVQDAAAALPARLLDAKAGERVLDLCAAPGGKTMQLAATGADVTAVDNSATRIKRLAENLARTGLAARIVEADALGFQDAPFDAILIDAPCSATGTIRRHPDLPYAKQDADFSELFDLQGKMLDHAQSLLKPGGRLVYCTCSLLAEEGEHIIQRGLDAGWGLSVDNDTAPPLGIPKNWLGPLGIRTRPDFWPEMGGMDGFFISLLRKPTK